jgi:exodeoxyribonuclease V alpha subunit
MTSLKVLVTGIIHKADDFYIITVEPLEPDPRSRESKIICKGRFFGIQGVVAGVPLELFGKWVLHPKFGRQFAFNGWGPWASSDVGVENFLRYCLGILDESKIFDLIDKFGKDSFRILSEEPDRLMEVPGFDKDTASSLLSAWTEAITSSELSALLADHEVTSEQMKALFSAFGSEARKIISDNPYSLMEVEGFDFDKVDDIAESRGISKVDPRRFEGAVLWLLREASQSGHLCLRRGDLSMNLRESMKSEVESFESTDLSKDLIEATSRLQAKGKVFIDPDVGVYLPSLFNFERRSAEYLAKFMTPLALDVDIKEFLSTYESIHDIQLSEAQQDAVNKLISNRVLVLTGGPGTGKTTVIKTFVELFDKAGVGFRLMAPTGIAAKRVAMVTGREAATVHRTFRFNGEEWGYSEWNKYPVGAVIIDEMSMVDQELFFRVVSSLEEGTILVFVGDDAQLPSVGPGSVLRDLVRCPAIPTVRLTQIFRQAQKSEIVVNSHRINRGEGILTGKEDSDFRFVSLDDSRIPDLIVKMASKLKDRDANFQVLSPKYDGIAGVTNLNERLREVLNPPGAGKTEVAFGKVSFRVGDRLMVIKNDYKLGVYNGDMGKLVDIRSDFLRVRVHGLGEDGLDANVEIPKSDVLQKLRLAYAITVHKCQGSEFDTIIIPMVREHGRMLQRNLFYTAITRAKKKVWVIGDRGSVQRAIDNDKVVARNTGFGKAILEAVGSGVAE